MLGSIKGKYCIHRVCFLGRVAVGAIAARDVVGHRVQEREMRF